MADQPAFTPEMASDPTMATEVLVRIATTRPDLHALLAKNPSLPEELRTWLATSPDPAVQDALEEYRNGVNAGAEGIAGGSETAGARAASEASQPGDPINTDSASDRGGIANSGSNTLGTGEGSDPLAVSGSSVGDEAVEAAASEWVPSDHEQTVQLSVMRRPLDVPSPSDDGRPVQDGGVSAGNTIDEGGAALENVGAPSGEGALGANTAVHPDNSGQPGDSAPSDSTASSTDNVPFADTHAAVTGPFADPSSATTAFAQEEQTFNGAGVDATDFATDAGHAEETVQLSTMRRPIEIPPTSVDLPDAGVPVGEPEPQVDAFSKAAVSEAAETSETATAPSAETPGSAVATPGADTPGHATFAGAETGALADIDDEDLEPTQLLSAEDRPYSSASNAEISAPQEATPQVVASAFEAQTNAPTPEAPGFQTPPADLPTVDQPGDSGVQVASPSSEWNIPRDDAPSTSGWTQPAHEDQVNTDWAQPIDVPAFGEGSVDVPARSERGQQGVDIPTFDPSSAAGIDVPAVGAGGEAGWTAPEAAGESAWTAPEAPGEGADVPGDAGVGSVPGADVPGQVWGQADADAQESVWTPPAPISIDEGGVPADIPGADGETFATVRTGDGVESADEVPAAGGVDIPAGDGVVSAVEPSSVDEQDAPATEDGVAEAAAQGVSVGESADTVTVPHADQALAETPGDRAVSGVEAAGEGETATEGEASSLESSDADPFRTDLEGSGRATEQVASEVASDSAVDQDSTSEQTVEETAVDAAEDNTGDAAHLSADHAGSVGAAAAEGPGVDAVLADSAEEASRRAVSQETAVPQQAGDSADSVESAAGESRGDSEIPGEHRAETPAEDTVPEIGTDPLDAGQETAISEGVETPVDSAEKETLTADSPVSEGVSTGSDSGESPDHVAFERPSWGAILSTQHSEESVDDGATRVLPRRFPPAVDASGTGPALVHHEESAAPVEESVASATSSAATAQAPAGGEWGPSPWLSGEPQQGPDGATATSGQAASAGGFAAPGAAPGAVTGSAPAAAPGSIPGSASVAPAGAPLPPPTGSPVPYVSSPQGPSGGAVPQVSAPGAGQSAQGGGQPPAHEQAAPVPFDPYTQAPYSNVGSGNPFAAASGQPGGEVPGKQSGAPTHPGQPVAAGQPTQSSAPSPSGQQGQPAQQGQPSQPGQPGQVAPASQPGQPAPFAQQAAPAPSGQPGQPTAPAPTPAGHPGQQAPAHVQTAQPSQQGQRPQEPSAAPATFSGATTSASVTGAPTAAAPTPGTPTGFAPPSGATPSPTGAADYSKTQGAAAPASDKGKTSERLAPGLVTPGAPAPSGPAGDRTPSSPTGPGRPAEDRPSGQAAAGAPASQPAQSPSTAQQQSYQGGFPQGYQGGFPAAGSQQQSAKSAPTAAEKKRRFTIIGVIAVVAILALLVLIWGISAIIGGLTGGTPGAAGQSETQSSVSAQPSGSIGEGSPNNGTPIDAPQLDDATPQQKELNNKCVQGDMAACDTLFAEKLPEDHLLHQSGKTCGFLDPDAKGGTCEADHGKKWTP